MLLKKKNIDNHGHSAVAPTNYEYEKIKVRGISAKGNVYEFATNRPVVSNSPLKFELVKQTDNPNVPTYVYVTFTFKGTEADKKEVVIADNNSTSLREITARHNTTEISLSGHLTETARLVVSPIEKASLSSENQEYLDNIANKESLLAIYDVSVADGTLEGAATVKFNLGESNNGKKVVVTHFKKDGTKELFNSTVENGVATVRVESLSPFAITEVSRFQDELQEIVVGGDKIALPFDDTNINNDWINKKKIKNVPVTLNDSDATMVTTIDNLPRGLSFDGNIITGTPIVEDSEWDRN